MVRGGRFPSYGTGKSESTCFVPPKLEAAAKCGDDMSVWTIHQKIMGAGQMLLSHYYSRWDGKIGALGRILGPRGLIAQSQ
jgi:hypothetical protein